MTDEELINGIEYIRNTMIAVATGGPRINDVNDQYQRMYANVSAALAKRGFILLHPSAAALLDHQDHRPSDDEKIGFIECSRDECANDLGVQLEIDYWRFKPTAESEAWYALQDMWSAAPQLAQRHYEATAQAINRMRVSQGAPPLLNLRRRTLPRKSMDV